MRRQLDAQPTGSLKEDAEVLDHLRPLDVAVAEREKRPTGRLRIGRHATLSSTGPKADSAEPGTRGHLAQASAHHMCHTLARIAQKDGRLDCLHTLDCLHRRATHCGTPTITHEAGEGVAVAKGNGVALLSIGQQAEGREPLVDKGQTTPKAVH